MKFVLFLLQGIPESAGLIGLSLALAGVPLRWKRIIVAATLLSLLIYLIRMLPVAFGLHSIAGLLLLTMFVIKTTHTSPSRAFVAVFASFAILILLETAVHEAFFSITKLNTHEVVDNYLLWSKLGMIHAVFLIVFAFLAARLKHPHKEAWKA